MIKLPAHALRCSAVALSLATAACGSSQAPKPQLLCEAPCAVAGRDFAGIKVLDADETGVYLVDAANGIEVLWRIPRQGARPVEIATPRSEVALRVGGGRAYWVDWVNAGNTITRIDSVAVGGGDLTTHFELGDSIVGFEVDEQNLYAQVLGPSQTFRIPLDGSPVTLYQSGGTSFRLALDAGTLFFVDLGPDGSACQIRSMPTAGGDATLLYDGQQSEAGDCGLGLFAHGGHLFWMDFSAGPEAGTLFTLPAAGGTPISLLEDVVLWAGNIESDEKSVYVGAALSDGRSGVIGVPIAGGDPVVLYATKPSVLAQDAARLYFLFDQSDGRGAVLSVPK